MLNKNDFDEIQDFLDNVFFKDEKAIEIIEKVNLSKEQISIINTLIINAIRAYDAKNSQNH